MGKMSKYSIVFINTLSIITFYRLLSINTLLVDLECDRSFPMKYIVDFHNDAPDADISKYLADNGCTVLKEWDNFDKVFLVEAAAEPPVTSIVAFVKDDEFTLAIKPKDIEINSYHNVSNPNFPQVTISTTDKKDWWKNYTLAQPIFDNPTTTYSQKGSNIHVYIMDSGIYSSHPEFEGVDVTNIYSVTGLDFNDYNGHGTALASIISGKTCGISSAKLKIVKIFDPNHATLQSEFLDALDAVMADLPEGHFGILNCSWAIPRNEWVEFKLKECIDDGLWIVAAAGNSGEPIPNVTPAAMPEVFTVGAYNQDLLPCDFSDYTGSAISVTGDATNHGVLDGWAPGQDIYAAVAWYEGNAEHGIIPTQPYSYTAGTSMAAAITSATLAHNLNDFCWADGKKLPDTEGYFLAGPGAVSAIIVGRKDLLDLTDPKYTDSKNVLVTLINLTDIKMPTDEITYALRAGSKSNLGRLFNPSVTKSVDILEPFPDNFTILPHGGVYATPTIEQGPTAGESFKLYTAKVSRVGVDDVEETVTVNIYVLAANYQPTDLPEDHDINIVLLGPCSLPAFMSCSLVFKSGCNDNCGGFFCCGGSGKESQCICVNAFGPE